MWWDERRPTHPGAYPQAAAVTPPPTPPPRQLKATVDLDCPYLRGLVLAALARRPAWAVTVVEGQGEEPGPGADTALLHWGEYERIAWDAVSAGAQVASSYAVRKGLIRKAQLARTLRKWATKRAAPAPRGSPGGSPGGRSALAAATPETLVLELDDVEYIDEALADCHEVRDMADGSAVWVAKPSLGNQAVGILVFDRVAALRAALEAHGEAFREWVLQRYIERPLLVGGRKFHVRAYVLCVGCLTAYVWGEALALFARDPYEPMRPGAPINLAAHLTNTCAADGEAASERDALVHTLAELPELLARDGVGLAAAQQRIARLRADMNAIIGECLEAVSGELTFFPLPNCFELFGFDLLVDEAWHVWLLEANAEPDFAQTGPRLQPLVGELVEGTLRLVTDPLARDRGWPGPAGDRNSELKGTQQGAGAGAGGESESVGAAAGWTEVFSSHRLAGEAKGVELGRPP